MDTERNTGQAKEIVLDFVQGSLFFLFAVFSRKTGGVYGKSVSGKRQGRIFLMD